MLYNLHGKSFLTLQDFSATDIGGLLDLATQLKAAKDIGAEYQYLRGKSIALIFEKNSTQTRMGFEVAAADQGAHVTHLDAASLQLGTKEANKNTARVLGRIYDGIEYRGADQNTVEELARYSGVPVFNGLTDQFHPTQILADFLTMLEYAEKPLAEVSFCYIGDARNSIANSLLVGAARMGMDVRICAPIGYQPDAVIQQNAHAYACDSGAKILITDEINIAVKGCEFIYTNAWLSMAESESEWTERIEHLQPYQVTKDVMNATLYSDTCFMHCLPAFSSAGTHIGEKIKDKFGLDSLEVTEEVFESLNSAVFDQAENRMHTIKAVLVATLYGSVDIPAGKHG